MLRNPIQHGHISKEGQHGCISGDASSEKSEKLGGGVNFDVILQSKGIPN